MNQTIINSAKEKLEKTKADLEHELEKIAEKDEKTEGDWDAKFPQFDREESGSGALEKAADEVEEYNTRLSLEHNLELRLKDINTALEKINKFVPGAIASGNYGKCENCQKEINLERIEIYPEARMCSECETAK